jgi:hypothetical protein
MFGKKLGRRLVTGKDNRYWYLGRAFSEKLINPSKCITTNLLRQLKKNKLFILRGK